MQYRKGFSLLEVNIAIVISIFLATSILKLFIIGLNISNKIIEEKKVVEIIEMIENEISYNIPENEIAEIFSEKKYINNKNLNFTAYSNLNFIQLLEDSSGKESYCEIQFTADNTINVKVHILKNEKETDKYETNFAYK